MMGTATPPVIAVIHVFYLEIWREWAPALVGTPVVVTCPVGRGIGAAVRAERPDVEVFECPNRGRDWLPFLHVLHHRPMAPETVIIKLHTKHSAHRLDAREWKNDLVRPLAGSPEAVRRVQQHFEREPGLGVLVAEGHLLPVGLQADWNRRWLERLTGESRFDGWLFPAGSMFAVRRAALDGILGLDLAPDRFEPEPLALDGQLPHAVERLVGWSAKRGGLQVRAIRADGEALLNDTRPSVRYTSENSALSVRPERRDATTVLAFGNRQSPLEILRLLAQAKKVMACDLVLLPQKWRGLQPVLASIFRRSKFHVTTATGGAFLQAKSLFQAAPSLLPQTPVAFLSMDEPDWSSFAEDIPHMAFHCTEPAGQEMWFARPEAGPDFDSLAAAAPVRQYFADLELRMELQDCPTPSTSLMFLSQRLTEIWVGSPMMPDETTERWLVGAMARTRGMG